MFARNRAPGRLVAMTVELAFISVEPPSEGERTLPHSRNSRKSLATIDQSSLLHPFTAISEQLSLSWVISRGGLPQAGRQSL